MKPPALLAMALLLITAACGSDDRQGAVGGAPLLTPAEAQDRDGLVAVQGFFWARPADNEFRLCETELESFPPQCGEPAVDVTGIDVADIAGIDFAQNVFRAEQLRARGQLADGTLAVEEIELNAKDAATGLTFRLLIPIEVNSGATDFIALMTNSSPVPIQVKFLSGQSADLTLTDPELGGVVYRWSADRSFTQAIRELTLAPGETTRFELEEPNFTLEAGAYDLQGVLTATPAPGSVRGRVVVR